MNILWFFNFIFIKIRIFITSHS